MKMKLKLFALGACAAALVACNGLSQHPAKKIAIDANSTEDQKIAYMIGNQLSANDFKMVPHQMGEYLDEDVVVQGVVDDLRAMDDTSFKLQISPDSMRAASFVLGSKARGRYGSIVMDSATLATLGGDPYKIQQYKDSVLNSLPVEPEGPVTKLPVKLDSTATKMQRFSYMVGIQYFSKFSSLSEEMHVKYDVDYFVLGIRDAASFARDTLFKMQMSADSIKAVNDRFSKMLTEAQKLNRQKEKEKQEQLKAEVAALRGDTLENGMPAKINFNVKVKGISAKFENLTSFAGKPLLLTYFSATCGHCAHTAPQIVEIFKEFEPKGLVSATVFTSSNNKRDMRKFMDEAKFDDRMNVVQDDNHVFGELYSDGYVPKIYLVNPDGSYKLYTSLDSEKEDLKREIGEVLNGKNVQSK